MNPEHKASSFRSQIRLSSHCKASWDCFWRFFAAVYLNLFSRGSMLVVNRRLFESNEPSCPLPFSCVLPKEGLRADFAIATRMLCHRNALTLPSQRAGFAIAACCAGPCSMILFAFCLFSPAEAGCFYFPLAPFPSRRSLFPFYISVLLPSILFHIGSNSLWFASRRQVYCSCLTMIMAFSSHLLV